MGWWGYGLTQGDTPQDIIMLIEDYVAERKIVSLAEIDLDDMLQQIGQVVGQEEDCLNITVAYFLVSRGVPLPEEFKQDVIDELNYLIEATESGDIGLLPAAGEADKVQLPITTMQLKHMRTVLRAIRDGDAELLNEESRQLKGVV